MSIRESLYKSVFVIRSTNRTLVAQGLFRWVRPLCRSPYSPGSSKNASGPVGLLRVQAINLALPRSVRACGATLLRLRDTGQGKSRPTGLGTRTHPTRSVNRPTQPTQPTNAADRSVFQLSASHSAGRKFRAYIKLSQRKISH